MHVHKPVQIVKDILNSKDLHGFAPRLNTGDFRVNIAQKKKKFLIIGLTTNFEEKIKEICKEASEKLPEGSMIETNDYGITFSNPIWEFDDKKKKVVKIPSELLTTGNSTAGTNGHENGHEKQTTQQQTIEESDLLEEKKEQPTTKDGFNTELLRFSFGLNRLETLMDELVLRRLSWKETLGQLYDNLKQNKVEVYSTSVQIQITGSSFIIPHLTRDAFIDIGLKSMTKT